MKPKHRQVEELTWDGCYDNNWNGMIVPDAFAHPAKYARGLIERIIKHGLEEGYWKKGDLCVDPFGGIATGGIICAHKGIRWVGCELEPRFVKLAEKNFKLHERTWKNLGLPMPRIVRGDSRRLGEILAGDATAVLSSPPYAESVKGEHGETETAKESRDKRRTKGGSLGKSARHGGYGKGEGQLGSMRAGEVGAVVSSPPFMENNVNIGGVGDTPGMRQQIHNSTKREQSYGGTEGQLGNENADTFWRAAREIVQQCHVVLRPDGYAVFVTKDFVRAKARVPFTDDWISLCEACGFRLVKRVRAMLVKETRRQGFTGEIVTRKERKSFFRRLAEKKGSPRIDWEDVTFFVKEKLP